MSNLGGYQWLTTAAKKVGGPKNLVLLIAGTGAVAFKSCEIIVKASVSAIKNKHNERKQSEEKNIKQYYIKTPAISDEGIEFKVGEMFRLLESDGEAVLIEKIGDTNNPYFVLAELLKKISDYKD